jgi:uncharacterized protein (DUF952 family)
VTALILHAALPEDWASSRRTGTYSISTRGRALADEGFIHASTPAQLDGVLRSFYADLGSLVLLVLDVTALAAAGSPVRWEQVPGAADPFPHVYGPIPSSVVGQGNPVVSATAVQRQPPDAAWHLAPTFGSGARLRCPQSALSGRAG